jgi:CheY-like chemotaxis protein/two-component sensor histidine kinase
VDDLLDVSRITRGKIRLETETVEAATVVRRAVETSRPLIEARKHELELSLPREPLWIEADATRVAQVLANLLNNAAKYTLERGKIKLGVTREGDNVVFRVRDNGLGISAELLPRVFEPFTQADTSLDRSRGGLGIGLTLVRRIVELHRGSVEARSDGPGKGSELIVRLPAANAPVVEAQPALTEPPSTARRILVVDDNADAADTLGEFLADSGHSVLVRYDGKTALEAVRAYRPEVVFLDIGLPGIDGFEVARRIRQEHGSSVRLVALTGYGQEEDRRRTREAGFDDHMVKPVGVDAISKLLAA